MKNTSSVCFLFNQLQGRIFFFFFRMADANWRRQCIRPTQQQWTKLLVGSEIHQLSKLCSLYSTLAQGSKGIKLVFMDVQVGSKRAVNMQDGSVWLHLVNGYLERRKIMLPLLHQGTPARFPLVLLFVLRHSAQCGRGTFTRGSG